MDKPTFTSEQSSLIQKIHEKVFSTSPDSITVSRLDNNQFVSVNDSFCNLTGYTREEIIGQTAASINLWIEPDKRQELISLLEKHGFVSNFTSLFKTKKGEIRTGLLSATIFYLDDIPYFLAIARDITEMAKTRESFMFLEGKYQNLIEIAPNGIAVLGLDGKIQIVNKALLEIIGSPKEELIGKSFLETPGIPPERKTEYQKIFEESLKAGENKTLQIELINKEGRRILTEILVSHIIKEGKLAGLQAIIRDITEEKQASEALRNSELFYRTSIDSLQDMFYVVDRDLKIILANRATIRGLEAIGGSPDLTGKHVMDVFPFLDKIVEERYHKVIKTGKSFEVSEKYKIGNIDFYAEAQLIPIKENGKVSRVLSIIKDITEQKRSELVQQVIYRIANAVNITENLPELFQVIQEELGRLFDTSNFFVALYDKESDTLSLPYMVDEKDAFDSFPAKNTMTGYMIKNDKPILMKDSEIEKLVKKGLVYDAGTPSKIWMGVPLKIKDNLMGAVVVQSYEDENAYTREDLEILKFVSTQIGLSIDSKKVYQAIRTEKAYFERLFETAPEAVVITANNGEIIRINQEFTRMFGYKLDEVQGKRIDNLIVPEAYEKEAVKYSDLVAKGHRIKTETTRKRKNGELLYVSILGTPVENDEGQIAVYGIYRDITDRKNAEEALKESESRYRTMIETAHDMILTVNTKGDLTYLNPQAEKMMGYRTEEIAGTNYSSFTHPDDKESMLKVMREVLKGETIESTVRSIDISGKIHIISYSAAPIYERGEIKGVVFFGRDVTMERQAQERLQESEEKLRNILFSSPDAIVTTDLEGRIMECNPASLEIFGASEPGELEGMFALEMVMKQYRYKGLKTLLQVRRDGYIKNAEFELATRNKRIISVDLSARIMRDEKDHPIGIVALVRDITQRNKDEQNLKEAKEKAEESDRLKSAFLANMSHEIRTPMNAILGFSEMLKLEDISREERDEYISLINSKGHELMEIISDIIDISKIEAGDLAIEKKRVPVRNFLEEIYTGFKEEMALTFRKWVQLRLNMPKKSDPVMDTDPIRLKQVFQNVVNNALKFTQEGYVEIGYEESKDNRVIFCVEDTGIGIAPNKQDIIFERFRQVDDSMNRKYGGTDLGLSISRNIIEALGGNIWVESMPGKGSRFFFSIPVIQEKKKKKAIKQDTGRHKDSEDFIVNLEGKTILIAEDDTANYLFLESVLKKTQCNIIWAKDGQQAMDIFMANPNTDLIFMDIRMPVLNGLEATRAIRDINPAVPVIALTAYAFSDDREKSMQAGCNDYLSKPVKMEHIFELLEKHLIK